jgi:glucosamine--fructose-6-phosphate aminotransferase (isomerizing)
MSARLPAWAQKLLDRHPSAARPTPDDPMPDWLAEDLARIPLWAFIRGADDVRCGHPYFLIEDVRQQPRLMAETLKLRGQLAEVAADLVAHKVERLVFTGCGSAFFCSLLGAWLFPEWTGLDAQPIESLELASYGLSSSLVATKSRPTAVIAQSATGGSYETLDALRRARGDGCATVGLSNTVGSAMDELCDSVVAQPTGQKCGPDVSVITTRLVMLYLLALEMGRARGVLPAAQLEALNRRIEALPDQAAMFLATQESRIEELAAVLKDQTALMFVGGGPNWFSARECALKVEEESSMFCKAYRPAEYPHDAIALLSPQATTVGLAPPGRSYDRVCDSVRTGQAAGSRGVALVAEDDDRLAKLADFTIRVPGELDETFLPPLATIFGQTLGYYLGVARGVNPDTLRTDQLTHAKAWLTSFPLGSH